MLKSLNGRHLGIIRRLIVGQSHAEIARDLGVSQPRISVLLSDPLFDAKLTEMQERTMEGFLDVRASAMEILQHAAPDAAKMVVEAFKTGRINDKPIGLKLQLDSVFDVLNRTGNKAVERSIIGAIDLGQLIADAYRDKHGSSSWSDPKEEMKRGGDNGDSEEKKSDTPFDVLKLTDDEVEVTDEGA